LLALGDTESLASCLLNPSCSAVTRPWFVDADVEFEGGADRDDAECWDIGSAFISSCLGVNAVVELANVITPLSRPETFIVLAFLYIFCFLTSDLSGVFNVAIFMASAVEMMPSDAAKSCAAIRSFSSTES